MTRSTNVAAIHQLMFPEEYDYQLDDTADASMRRLGKNPMSDGYILERNKLRAELGFGPYVIETVGQKLDRSLKGRPAGDKSTIAWVALEIKNGNERTLHAILEERGIDISELKLGD